MTPNPVSKLRQVVEYLWQKLPEIFDLGPKDALLAKLVLDIHRKRTHSATDMVPLHRLQPVHALDRPEVMQKVEDRVAAVAEAKPGLMERRRLRREDLMDVMPSVSGFKVVATPEGDFIAFEGNGRLEALRRVFESGDEMLIEVEVYYFVDDRKIVRRARRVQRRNGVGPFASPTTNPAS